VQDALPLGSFTKYTWGFTNILHVKQIFDTPQGRLLDSLHYIDIFIRVVTQSPYATINNLPY
jgi:hypothetical protein